MSAPFADFIQPSPYPSELRRSCTAAYRRAEPDCLRLLLPEARLPAEQDRAAGQYATELILALRAKGQGSRSGVAALIHEYALSSREGVALMCLAEALLRIPDVATRDALIRDKLASGDWRSHVGRSESLFVNAATWGLLVTGKLTTTTSETGLYAALARLVNLGGEPLIRKGLDLAMRLMGEQFVAGQNIDEALANSQARHKRGFRHSYDMLGEAAATAADAQRYYEHYLAAVHAIGKAAGGAGIYEGPGISVKLSALHPRYSRSQSARVHAELLPRLRELVLLARHYDIGFNIDAEETERLDISLDLLEALCRDPQLAGWHGIGLAVQAYQKRAYYVVDWLVDLARRTQRRLMVRLVKGAYWDSEIKRAQVEGLQDFPVFTRKVHTDVSYLACARKLLRAPDAVFPQFATHNARTLAAILQMGGANYYRGQYEFQCLHGMGEPLYDEIVGGGRINRPCRIYAPVGTHETLLAYLVRRLLENGANTSFVNRVSDASVPVTELAADPVALVANGTPPGAPHPQIANPRELFGAERRNSSGVDLSNEECLESLAVALSVDARQVHVATPIVSGQELVRAERAVRNPADTRDLVGSVGEATPGDVAAACAAAEAAGSEWAALPVAQRAAILARAADLLEARRVPLMGLLSREAGKTVPNAVAEVREAVDFLRYYGAQASTALDSRHVRPLGPVACISPWNFPLAIFIGQLAAALAAGNTVLAKPAEETPLVAAAAVRALHEAGVPVGALHLLPGDGAMGAALVADPRVHAVMFTGSTEVARGIQRQLAKRISPQGWPIPLVAETGGQNAMIVDSSALTEQVVGDVLASAFDSAGQRCSALRILCLQEEIATRTIAMLKGAMQELRVGSPDQLCVDVGPIISASAQSDIRDHVEAMRAGGHAVTSAHLSEETRHGNFLAPTLIEINRIDELQREVFGPVLHVLRYRREELDALVDAINDTGYGLTFGLHTRIDETIDQVTRRIRAGNIYVNRNTVGAVVGVQPFGGHGLSGTGPKAGGPLYLWRLVSRNPAAGEADTRVPGTLDLAAGRRLELAGPVGESNVYVLERRGRIAAIADTAAALRMQIEFILASGSDAIVQPGEVSATVLAEVPQDLCARIHALADWRTAADLAGVLFAGDTAALLALSGAVAAREGAIVPVQSAATGRLLCCEEGYRLELLLREVSISTNTSAAGGNASLMKLG
jgi:RHH-type proline utilization regulon transcriptional repressor/proline dehydrogenase/delta 1-pyrroline-5-carboxylate dehydrogenase